MKYFLIIFVSICLMLACTPGKSSLKQTTPYTETFPNYFPTMPVTQDNPLTNEGVQLGRMLYYDKILHPNQEMSCSSCHTQSTGFSNPGSNSLAHINIGFNSSFLWNGKIEGSLEDIMMFEVEEFFQTDLSLLNEHDEYPMLFQKAFGAREITSKEVAYALAQFFRTLNSYNSKYDLVMQGLATFTPEEANGYDIFFTERGDCFHCHGGALFNDNLFHNNALDSDPDNGRYDITFDNSDIGKFKTPTLRNIEFTAPYMHDGRYQTLEEVIQFYSYELQSSPTVDPLMKYVDFPGGVALDAQEVNDLIAFLRTLSDTTFLNNPALSDPF